MTRGFKYLPVEIKNKYGEFIADYLKHDVSTSAKSLSNAAIA
jgi:hypothetical protein